MRHHVHHVARQLKIDRPFEAGRRKQHAINLVKGRDRIGELSTRDTEFFKDISLCAEFAHLMVQERVARPLVQPRRARY